MPCRGRAEQTVRNVKRLLATAGDVEWSLYLVGGDNEVGLIWKACSEADITLEKISMMTTAAQRVTYWQALEIATRNTDAPLIVNLANDLLPGQHWLQRAVAAYHATFANDYAMLGFNDGHHETDHSCHFLIGRNLLELFGGWPVWYDHNFGDTELCQRAIEKGVYAKAPWATLYHDHPYFGGADDGVYAEGRASSERDRQLYEQRRAAGWPTVSP